MKYRVIIGVMKLFQFLNLFAFLKFSVNGDSSKQRQLFFRFLESCDLQN